MEQQIPLFVVEPVQQKRDFGTVEIFNESCLETMQCLGEM